jgi:hypothetical protein
MIVVARASVRISLHSIKERGGVSGELGRQDRHAPDRCVDPVCEERSAAFSRHARLGLVVPAVFHCKRARDLGALALVPCSVTLQGWDVEIADQWRRFVAVRFARDSLLRIRTLSPTLKLETPTGSSSSTARAALLVEACSARFWWSGEDVNFMLARLTTSHGRPGRRRRPRRLVLEGHDGAPTRPGIVGAG